MQLQLLNLLHKEKKQEKLFNLISNVDKLLNLNSKKKKLHKLEKKKL